MIYDMYCPLRCTVPTLSITHCLYTRNQIGDPMDRWCDVGGILSFISIPSPLEIREAIVSTPPTVYSPHRKNHGGELVPVALLRSCLLGADPCPCSPAPLFHYISRLKRLIL
jgi:hypothetical protein